MFGTELGIESSTDFGTELGTAFGATFSTEPALSPH